MSPQSTLNNDYLPQGWIWTNLGEIHFDDSHSFSPGEDTTRLYELYSVPSFAAQKPEIVNERSIGSSKRVVSENTVLLCKINPRINRVWIVSKHSPYEKLASTEWIPFSPIDKIIPKYLAYFMQIERFRDFLSLNVSGVGGSLTRVSPKVIDTYPFPLAPLAEQQRIVDQLEIQLTRLDVVFTILKKVRIKLEQYKKTVLNTACTGYNGPQKLDHMLRYTKPNHVEGTDDTTPTIYRQVQISGGPGSAKRHAEHQ